MRAVLSVVGLLLTSSACGDGPTVEPDAGWAREAGLAVDAGLSADAGVVSAVDSGASDAGLLDVRVADAGMVPAVWSQVQAILRASCKPCHNPGNRDNRTVVWVYDNLVGATGARFPLVVPGDRSQSFLYVKISDGVAAYCGAKMPPANRCGNVMPPPPTRARLLAWQIELVGAWIEAGAER